MQLRESRKHPEGRWSHAPLHEVSQRSGGHLKKGKFTYANSPW
jgi:hypothetical protein